jgi:hypothetical protein
MYTTSRRNLLRSLSCLPAALVLPRFLPTVQATPLPLTGNLNLHLRGPFTYLFFANPNRKEILIVSPDPLNHHLPFISSQYAEAPIQKQDYVLAGVNPTAKSQPDWTDTTVSRITIPAGKLKMDMGGVIDSGKAQRFFSLSVPSPDWIVPWHPIEITVTGTDSPYNTKVWLPVGYTFVYQNQTFAQVALNCPANTTYNWAPKLTPYPGQDAADLLVEMASSLDVDCKHKGATDAFADECAIYTGVNPGARLDLGLDYGPPMAGCQSLAEALKKRKPHRAMPPKPEDAKGHTGTDCKAGLLEIINVSDNVKLG